MYKRQELEYVILAVVFLSDAIDIVNLVIGKTESNCRSVLISYANSIACLLYTSSALRSYARTRQKKRPS